MNKNKEKWKFIKLPAIDNRRQNRWYYGGLSSTISVFVTHPLDLLKVVLQTQETKGQLLHSIRTVHQNEGFFGFYNGVSASLTRQMTSTMTRFGMYEVLRAQVKTDTFAKKAFLASIAGLIGSLVGVPLDVVNVRMQNDMKLPAAQRRNYRHVMHGLVVTHREGGVAALFSGCIPAVLRGMILTICPIAVYDQTKSVLLETYFTEETVLLHLSSSLLVSALATILAQPLDVIKTRTMCYPNHLVQNAWQVASITCKEGPSAFYKGILPSFMRLGPHTVLLLVLMEQFRLHWGWLPPDINDSKELWKLIKLPAIDNRRQNRWYYGGLSSTISVFVTHPLDLLKVVLQTQETKGQLLKSIRTVYRNKGFFGFYNGVSASLTRQMTSTMTRFGMYEVLRAQVKTDTFAKKAFVASLAGCIGSLVGVPLDVVNVRMQKDMRLLADQRRNYRHVIHGLVVTHREGGFGALFSGCIPAVLRGIILTICPIAVYDQTKSTLLKLYFAEETICLHLTSSILVSALATFLTQPLDVIKTRTMGFPSQPVPNPLKMAIITCKEGPLAFYKGILPSFMRLGPHTVLLLVIMEQLRLHWGWLPSEYDKS